MNDESEHQEWILCPKCGNKTRLKLRKDTVLTNFPLFCPKCKEESLIDAEKFIVKEGDAVDTIVYLTNKKNGMHQQPSFSYFRKSSPGSIWDAATKKPYAL